MSKPQLCPVCSNVVLEYVDGEGIVHSVCKCRSKVRFGYATIEEAETAPKGKDFIMKGGGRFGHACGKCETHLAQSDGKVKFTMECGACGFLNTFEKGLEVESKGGYGFSTRTELQVKH